MAKNKFNEPIHRVCEICNDDGLCLNNEKHPNYDNDLIGGADYWDCVNYLEKKNNTIGYTMMNWMKRMGKKTLLTLMFIFLGLMFLNQFIITNHLSHQD